MNKQRNSKIMTFNGYEYGQSLEQLQVKAVLSRWKKGEDLNELCDLVDDKELGALLKKYIKRNVVFSVNSIIRDAGFRV